MATTYVINGIPTKLESESGAEFVGVVNGIPVFYSLPEGGETPTFKPYWAQNATRIAI